MQLEHRFSVPASVETTWEAFNDLNRIGGCLPGATITSVDGDDFTGSVKVKLGPISLLYNGTGSYTTRDEATRTVVIDAKGKDKRGNGTASAVITARLVAEGQGTAVEVDTDLSITGKPAQFGRGVIQDVSDKLLGQFVDCIKAKLTDPAPAAPAAEVADVSAGEAGVGGKSGPPLDNAPPGGARSKAAAQPGGSGAAFPTSDAPGAPGKDQPPVPGRPPTPTAPSPDSTKPQGTSTATAVSGPEPELDLFATVGPVLIKRYAAPVLGGLVLLLILRKLFGGKGRSD